jgi:CHAT domain-containing protein/tetratricopeptide (TPR) repeat protein
MTPTRDQPRLVSSDSFGFRVGPFNSFTFSRHRFARGCRSESARLLAAVTLLAVLAPLPSAAQTPSTEPRAHEPAAQLETGKPVERELKGGETHAYAVRLETGQLFEAVVEQRGVDVVVVLVGPDGKSLLEVDSPNGTEGPEPVSLVADGAGEHRLEVRALEKGAPTGRYELRVTALRAATDHDRIASEIANLVQRVALLRAGGKFDEAIPLAERIVALCERLYGQPHQEVARAVKRLGRLYADKADVVRAEEHFERALSILRSALGDENPDVARMEVEIGEFYRYTTQKERSETLLRHALETYEKIYGPDHEMVAFTLCILAITLDYRRKYSESEAAFLRAIAIRERLNGPDHPSLTAPLQDLGTMYLQMNDVSRAEECFRRALAIHERNSPADHPNIGSSHMNLGNAGTKKGDYAQAQVHYERALEIYEKAYGPKSPRLADVVQNLGETVRRRGNYAAAERYLLRVNELRARDQSSNRQSGIIALFNCYWAWGKHDKALEQLTTLAEIVEQYVARQIAAGTARDKIAFVGGSLHMSVYTAFHFSAMANDPRAARAAMTMILRMKCRALDVVAQSAGHARRSGGTDAALADELNAVRSEIAKRTLEGGPGRERLRELADREAEIERVLSRRSAERLVDATPVTLERVQAAIPADSALVEFVRFVPTARNEAEPEPPHYAAYVARAEGPAQGIDLGPAERIDALVSAFRTAAANASHGDVSRIGRDLDEAIMRPIRPAIGSATHVILSPERSLALVPFGALVDESGRYLVERYLLSCVTSGRDLLRFDVPGGSTTEPLVVANPSFDQTESGEDESMTASTRAAPGRNFRPLPAAQAEADVIGRMLPGATVLTRSQATERAVKQAAAPRILHVATHGFYAGEAPAAARAATGGAGEIEDPLVRSGVALAGANRRLSAGGEDGILTALEASGLDLWGTELVVLSACDTALGEICKGDGVFGLRRALVLAGSKTQVMSLWAINDRTTRELMVAYYKELLKGTGRAEAMRRAQLAMLRVPKRRHPAFWAAFIVSGDWRPLTTSR